MQGRRLPRRGVDPVLHAENPGYPLVAAGAREELSAAVMSLRGTVFCSVLELNVCFLTLQSRTYHV